MDYGRSVLPSRRLSGSRGGVRRASYSDRLLSGFSSSPSELVSVSASFRRRVEMVDLEEQDEMYIGAIGFVIAGQFVLKAEEVSFVVRFS